MLELIRSLEKMETTYYFYYIISLDCELNWKKSILLKNIKFGGTKYFSTLKFHNVVKDVNFYTYKTFLYLDCF